VDPDPMVRIREHWFPTLSHEEKALTLSGNFGGGSTIPGVTKRAV
jgi:hypothetical protein